MGGRVLKVLGGVGAALTVVVAGAGGVTWFNAQKANVADGVVVVQTPTSSASSIATAVPERSTSSQVSTEAASDLEFTNPPVPAPVPMRFDEWIIHPNASLDEFPLEKDFLPELTCLSTDFPTTEAFNACLTTKQGCSDRQVQWLKSNATLASPRLWSVDGQIHLGQVVLKNKSKSSQSISFRNIRAEISTTPVPDAGTSVSCGSYNDWYGGATAGQSQFREIVLPGKGGAGVFGPSPSWGEDLTRTIPEGSPAVINLAAGESAQVAIATKVGQRVGTISGRVVATVIAADGDRDIDIPVTVLAKGAATYSTSQRPTLVVNGGALCPTDVTRSRLYTARNAKICTIQQFKAENELD